ncbi:MAG: hypothetical protein ACYTGW_19240 [Planctomycetota bacterium]|jgi:hypothetical protein
MILPAVLLSLALATTVSAQAASYTFVSQLPPYQNPSPAVLTALTLPKIGAKLRLQVPFSWRQRNGVGADSVLATGVRNPFFNVPAFQGFVFTSAEIVLPTPMSPLGVPGNTTMEFPVPNSTQLIGVKFFQQVLTVPTTTPVGRLSRGGIGVVGR